MKLKDIITDDRVEIYELNTSIQSPTMCGAMLFKGNPMCLHSAILERKVFRLFDYTPTVIIVYPEEQNKFATEDWYTLSLCVQSAIHGFDVNIMEHDIYLSGGTPKNRSIDWENYDRDRTLQTIERLKILANKCKEEI